MTKNARKGFRLLVVAALLASGCGLRSETATVAPEPEQPPASSTVASSERMAEDSDRSGTPPSTTAFTEVPASTTTLAIPPPPAPPYRQWSSDFDALGNREFGELDRQEIDTLFSAELDWAEGFGNASITTTEVKTALRIRYVPDASGSSNVSAAINVPASDQMTLTYFVFLEPGWEFVRGGKLPGLCGGARASGGVGGNGEDGFSARFMWRAEGALVVYAYHPDRPGIYGEDILTTARLPVGQWVEVTQEVTMNTPGESDGRVRAWIDGRIVVDSNGFRWSTDGSFAIDKVCFSTFFGGNDESWSPTGEVRAQFAGFSTY